MQCIEYRRHCTKIMNFNYQRNLISIKNLRQNIFQNRSTFSAAFCVDNVEYLSSPPPFLCSQIITPFLNSMIFTNQEEGLDF